MKPVKSILLTVAVAIGLGNSTALGQTPVGTAFTYQGQLKLAGSPLNDTADFEFTLWDADFGGNQIARLVAVNDVNVVDGLFTALLDFGVQPYTTNERRWLEIAVRSPSGQGNFTTLSPRQELTATPFSSATRGLVVDADGNVAVQGDVRTTALVFASGYVSNSPLIFYAPDDPITERARIDDITGYFGIGTITPNGPLHVQSRVNINNGTNFADRRAPLVVGNGDGTGNAILIDGNQIEAASGIDLIINFNSPADLRINEGGGNVGIGTNRPTRMLEIEGNKPDIRMSTTDFSNLDLWMRADGVDKAHIGYDPGDQKLYLNNIATSSDKSLTLDADGNVAIEALEAVGTVAAGAFLGDGSALSGVSRVGATVNLDHVALLRWDLLNRGFPVGDRPQSVAFDGTNIWVANAGDDTVTKLRASDGVEYPDSPYPAGVNPYAIAFDGANIWVANRSRGRVTKLRASNGEILDWFPVGNGPTGVAFDGVYIWVTNFNDNNVTKLRASNGVEAPGSPYPVREDPIAVAFDGTRIWVANSGENTVSILLASNGNPRGVYFVEDGPSDVAFDGTNIWVTNFDHHSVTKLLASDGSEYPGSPYPVGLRPSSVTFDGTNIWVTSSAQSLVTKLRATDGVNLGTFPVGDRPEDAAFDGANIWVVNQDPETVTRISLVK